MSGPRRSSFLRPAPRTVASAAPVEMHQEEALGRAYDARLIRRLWGFIQPYRHLFWLSVLCLPISSGLMLVQPYLLKLAIDHHIAVGDARGLTTIGAIYIAAIIGECAFFYIQYWLTMLMAQRTLADLRVRVFAHVQTLPMSYFDRNPIGRLVTRLTSDVDVLNEMFAAGAMTIFMDVLTLVGIVAIMLSINWRLALVALAVMPFMMVALNFFRLAARRTYRLIRERIARLNAYLQEALSGMMIVQLFAGEQRCYQEFDALNDAHREANHWSNIYEAALFSMVEAMASVSAALMVWYAAGGIRAGAIAFGTLVAFIEYIQRFFIPIREFSTKYAVMQSAMASAERVFQLLDTEPTIVSPRTPRLPQSAPGTIEFDGVWFAYKREEYVLRDISFRVQPGEKIAIVGATGSGKTSVIKLLSRFYDVNRGHVRVDGIDVREWDLDRLRRHIGVVMQDVFLFSGDIASNISLGRPEISPAIMEEAAAPCERVVVHPRAAEWLPGEGARARQQPVDRAAPAARVRARARLRSDDPRPRRSHLERRHRDRDADPGRALHPDARPHRVGRRAPPLDHRACRSHHRAAPWRGARDRDAPGADRRAGRLLPPLSVAVRPSRRRAARRAGRVAVVTRPPLVGARRSARIGRALLLATVVAVAGCSPGYVLRAGYEEAKILWRREPFERALARGNLDGDERRKINAVLAARDFARGLGFNVGGSYASLSYVDGDTTLFVLTAAPRTALRPHTWWFPIVGEVPYKGFFDRARAEAEVAALEAQGYDTAVRTAAAFSTLGWFDDPLLRHLLRHDEAFLVDLVLHELYHNTFYVPGHTAFNESLATFVGHRAAIAFFAARPGEEASARRAETVWAETLRFAAFVQGLADRLRAVYAEAAGRGRRTRGPRRGVRGGAGGVHEPSVSPRAASAAFSPCR